MCGFLIPGNSLHFSYTIWLSYNFIQFQYYLDLVQTSQVKALVPQDGPPT